MSEKALHSCKVSVPTTSANLGVGFDCLGLALDLVADFTFEPADALSIGGCEQRFQGEDNLVWQSYLTACKAFGYTADPLAITIDSPIPLSGGLGSSSACVVAGIVAAQLVHGAEVDEIATLRCGVAIEGHPDNIAPAILGGVVSSFVADGETHSTREDVAPYLRFVAIAPDVEVRTEDARRAMPSEIPLDVAVWQMGRCMPTVVALATGDTDLLSLACQDKLHEPYRKKLIPCYDACREAARTAGACAFFISGSGSAMIAVCDSDEVAAQIESACATATNGAWIRTLHARAEGFTYDLLS